MAFNWLEFLFDDHDLAREFWVHDDIMVPDKTGAFYLWHMEKLQKSSSKYSYIGLHDFLEFKPNKKFIEFVEEAINDTCFEIVEDIEVYLANALRNNTPATHIQSVLDISLKQIEEVKKKYIIYYAEQTLKQAPRYAITRENNKHDWNSQIFTLVGKDRKIKEQSPWTI